MRASYTIEQVTEDRESFGPYRYQIYKNGVLVAHYRHDYRGDDHEIEFIDGTRVSYPAGRMIEFLGGGDPLPLALSQRAIQLLDHKLNGA